MWASAFRVLFTSDFGGRVKFVIIDILRNAKPHVYLLLHLNIPQILPWISILEPHKPRSNPSTGNSKFKI